MQIKKKKILYLSLIIICVLIIPFFIGRWNVSDKLTVMTIKVVKIGMSKSEVISVLGQPFSAKKEPAEFYGDNYEVLKFAKSVPWSKWYPMLWVHFKDDQVVEVYAKRYEFFDEKSIYILKEYKSWESELFKKSFPKAKQD